MEANTLLNGSRAMSFVAGPAVGGVLVQVLTAPVALVADALSYLYSAVLLGRIRPAEPPPSTAPGLGIGAGPAVHRPLAGAAGDAARHHHAQPVQLHVRRAVRAVRSTDLHISPGRARRWSSGSARSARCSAPR